MSEQLRTTLGDLKRNAQVVTNPLRDAIAEHGEDALVVAEYNVTPWGRFLLGWTYCSIGPRA